jgi:predicted transposase YbfD/YdcC
MEELIELLKESAEVYKQFLELEYKKYDIVIKNDVISLDDIVSKEQVVFLKMRGLEQKREKLIVSFGMNGKTFKEIIDNQDEDENLLSEYQNLKSIISEVKKISSLCKTLIEVRLHRLDKAMSQLGESENTYTNKEIKNGSAKSLIISKKI